MPMHEMRKMAESPTTRPTKPPKDPPISGRLSWTFALCTRYSRWECRMFTHETRTYQGQRGDFCLLRSWCVLPLAFHHDDHYVTKIDLFSAFRR